MLACLHMAFERVDTSDTGCENFTTCIFTTPGNRLGGSLPQAWSALSRLLRLSLDSNRLVGSLPPGWSALGQLRLLNVSSNALLG